MRSVLLALFIAAPVFAVDVNLAWDPVPDTRVSEYEVGRGTESGRYTLFQSFPALVTAATVQGLANGDEWFFAVRACGPNHFQCSDWSNEVSAAIPFAAPGNLKLFIVVPSR